MRSKNFAIGALLVGLAVGACGDDSSGEATSPAPTAGDLVDTTATTEASTTTAVTDTDGTDAPTTTGAPDADADEGDAPGTAISASDGVLSDGVWEVGDAGIVEFVLADGQLELVDASANEGWQMTIDEEWPDEIEVDFKRDNLEYQIEIKYENGILEIEIDLDIDPAEAGSFDIGPAGVATISAADGRVNLDDLAATDGWSVVEQDTDDDEVEIELRQDNVNWEFRADQDDGRLEVEIDFEIEGQFP